MVSLIVIAAVTSASAIGTARLNAPAVMTANLLTTNPMSNRFLFSYFDSLPGMDIVNERVLISLWVERWRQFGFTPVVLNEFYARQHPAFDIFDEAVSKLPSINPPGYDLACYRRWIAAEVAAKEYPNPSGAIVLSDYDTILYRPILHFSALLDPQPEPPSQMHCFHGNCPALVVGTPEQFADMARAFVNAELPPGTVHTSDQYLFEAEIMKHPERFKVSMDCVLFSDKGWETAAAIHFSNSVMQPKYVPKWEWITKLRA